MASEEDATPETRFVRHTPAGSVELPNNKWLRSPLQKDYAICLDPENRFHGWLMLEGWDNNWVSVRELDREDFQKLMTKAVVNQAHKVMIQAHLDRAVDHG